MKLYGYGPTRSARVLWTLRELDYEFEEIDGRPLIGTDEYKKIQPLGALPALVLDDGRVIFESPVICNYLADSKPEAGLIAEPGTWDRVMHDQWTMFVMVELEAWLWVNAKHTFVYPEDQRIQAIHEPNAREVEKAAAILERELSERDYLVGDSFSVADINASYAVNWTRRAGLLGDFKNLQAYLERVFERQHCALPRD